MTSGISFVLGHVRKKVITTALHATALCACGSAEDTGPYYGELVECDERGWAPIDDAGLQRQEPGFAISQWFRIPAEEGDTVTVTYCGEYRIVNDSVVADEPDDCTQDTFVSSGSAVVWCHDESYSETTYLADGWTAIYYTVE